MDMKKYQPDAEQLETGKRYEFSDFGSAWARDTLVGAIKRGGEKVYETRCAWWKYIREDQSEAGVIKEKQIKLTNDEWYLCNVQESPGCWVEKPLKCNNGWFDGWHISNVVALHSLIKAPLDNSCE